MGYAAVHWNSTVGIHFNHCESNLTTASRSVDGLIGLLIPYISPKGNYFAVWAQIWWYHRLEWPWRDSSNRVNGSKIKPLLLFTVVSHNIPLSFHLLPTVCLGFFSQWSWSNHSSAFLENAYLCHFGNYLFNSLEELLLFLWLSFAFCLCDPK